MQITSLKIYLALLASVKYFLVFSTKVTCVFVTHCLKHLLGYGFFTKNEITKGEQLWNCHGELIDEVTVDGREEQYEIQGKGSYLFFFTQNNKRMW